MGLCQGEWREEGGEEGEDVTYNATLPLGSMAAGMVYFAVVGPSVRVMGAMKTQSLVSVVERQSMIYVVAVSSC